MRGQLRRSVTPSNGATVLPLVKYSQNDQIPFLAEELAGLGRNALKSCVCFHQESLAQTALAASYRAIAPRRSLHASGRMRKVISIASR
jgi:hypothetical protein